VQTRYATFKNVLYQAVARRRFLMMARKLTLRVMGGPGHQQDHARWAASNATDMDHVMNNLDSELWQESQVASDYIQAEAARVLAQYPVRLGGAGCYPLIYFVTRMLKPQVAVETGVAAGFSSYATLLAMKANDRGVLYSSDLPYFRISHPEQYVGVLVPEELRDRWRLSVDGDRRNIPTILNELACIDFIHYDSDKSYRERKWTMRQLLPVISDGGVVIMDDIQDDSYFGELVAGTSNWHVFRFGGKYVGVIGLDSLAAPARQQ
jgi:predicted O-methyltransferase YrrM